MKIKTALFILFIEVVFLSLAYSEGPIYKHSEPEKQLEFINVYKDIRTRGLTVTSNALCIDFPTLCVDPVNDRVNIGTTTNTSAHLQVSSTTPGGEAKIQVINRNNSNSSSSAVLEAVSGGSSSGDPFVRWSVEGVTVWAGGIDNSDSDSWKLSNANTLGLNDQFVAKINGGGIAVKATNTNDNPSLGFYGEHRSTRTTNTEAAATSGVWNTYISTTISSGDWQCSGGMIWLMNSATVQQFNSGLSLFADNTTTDHFQGDTFYSIAGSPVAGTALSIAIPPLRFSVNSETTVNLKGQAEYTAGTPRMFAGSIHCWRPR